MRQLFFTLFVAIVWVAVSSIPAFTYNPDIIRKQRFDNPELVFIVIEKDVCGYDDLGAKRLTIRDLEDVIKN